MNPLPYKARVELFTAIDWCEPPKT